VDARRGSDPLRKERRRAEGDLDRADRERRRTGKPDTTLRAAHGEIEASRDQERGPDPRAAPVAQEPGRHDDREGAGRDREPDRKRGQRARPPLHDAARDRNQGRIRREHRGRPVRKLRRHEPPRLGREA